MTGIERLRELVDSISPIIPLCGVTKSSYDRSHIEMAGVRLRDFLADIADQIEREHDAEVADSPYDAILPEDREAIAWVREHGGLDSVKKLLDWVVGHCSTRQQLDFDFWLSGRVMYELGFDEDMADRDEVERRLLARLMPEGMEWLVEAWPRFEDSRPVRFSDDFERYGDENGVSVVTMYSDGSFALNFRAYSKGERVNRPAPKVYDADGAEIREGDEVWHVRGEFGPRFVSKFETHDGRPVAVFEPNGTDLRGCECDQLTHRAPVLAADDKPLEAGQTVWSTEDGGSYKVDAPLSVDCYGVRLLNGRTPFRRSPDTLTHERPESKCRDCAHWQKDPTADNMGVCWFFYHEHEGQDCYAARRADIGACEEFMPRTSALAERDA